MATKVLNSFALMEEIIKYINEKTEVYHSPDTISLRTLVGELNKFGVEVTLEECAHAINEAIDKNMASLVCFGLSSDEQLDVLICFRAKNKG